MQIVIKLALKQLILKQNAAQKLLQKFVQLQKPSVRRPSFNGTASSSQDFGPIKLPAWPLRKRPIMCLRHARARLVQANPGRKTSVLTKTLGIQEAYVKSRTSKSWGQERDKGNLNLTLVEKWAGPSNLGLYSYTAAPEEEEEEAETAIQSPASEVTSYLTEDHTSGHPEQDSDASHPINCERGKIISNRRPGLHRHRASRGLV